MDARTEDEYYRTDFELHLQRRPGRVILHLVNLTNAGTWRRPIPEGTGVQPFLISEQA